MPHTYACHNQQLHDVYAYNAVIIVSEMYMKCGVKYGKRLLLTKVHHNSKNIRCSSECLRLMLMAIRYHLNSSVPRTGC